MTVLGPADPEKLGPTITHEHLLIDFRVVFQPPAEASQAGLAREENRAAGSNTSRLNSLITESISS